MTERESAKRRALRLNNETANAITRECIESALLLLMEERPFEEIGVTDIAQKAGVSRNAYYRNYGSKEAILENYLDKVIVETSKSLSRFDPKSEGEQSWIELLRLTKKHSKGYKLLIDAGFGDKILRRFISSMNNNPENLLEVHISNCYLAGCLYAVITQWVLDGMKPKESTIAKVCTSLMFDGLKEVRKCEVE
jgi:AcrR family transcriptional regulator